MAEHKTSKPAKNEYIRVPIRFTAREKKGNENSFDSASFIELREPHGEHLRTSRGRELIAPLNPDMPLESGFQLQVVNRAITNASLGESPLLFLDVPAEKIIDLARLGIAVEEFLVNKTHQTTWVNFNFHSRPPMNPAALTDAQYNPLTLDIHGRNISDARNWTRPPAIHGAWGMDVAELDADQTRRDIEWMTQHHTDLSAFREIEMEQRRWGMDIVPSPSNATDFIGWQNHPSGFYYEGGRRTYFLSEMRKLQQIYGSKAFQERVKEIDALKLFQKPPVVNHDFDHSEIFPSNETDMVLFEAKFGERSYQVVTQTVPLVDRRDGIHMVVKLRPEPHTPWEDPTQSLEALAIGIGLGRLFQEHKALASDSSDGEIGDAYFDFNSNWSMVKKRELLDTMTDEEIKVAIQKDTRAHLHVQFEKMDAHWEIPPAPGTFTSNRPQTEETIKKIRSILTNKDHGLIAWIENNFS